MKLYNKTRCPDSMLWSVLLRAARACGKVRSSSVVVFVTQGSAGRCSGKAYECIWVRPRKGGRRINTDGGYFEIVLPGHGPHAKTCWTRPDGLAWAETFYYIAVHEWGHIRDYQAGGSRILAWDRPQSGRRRASHDDRPEERRANRYCAEAAERVASGRAAAPDDAILGLAVWIEEQLLGENKMKSILKVQGEDR